MRKGLLVTLVALLCGAILIFSYLTYQNRLEEAARVKTDEETVTNEPEENTTSEPEQNGEENTDSVSIKQEELEILSANTDAKVQEVLLARLEAGEPAQMVVIGSGEIQGIADRLADAVNEAYGDFLTVDAFAFDGTSAEFVEQGVPNLAWTNEYDIVLYEPFTLNNNGIVVIEDEHAHIAQVEERAMEAVQDSAFLITPSHPIENAGYYLTQIDSLKNYAEQQGIPYVDTWNNWPMDELDSYLDENGVPTEQGLDVWADALIQYFIAQ
ncbi:hypothetical protein C772_01458 [Bhargavaea cecembensis DSE10]|uniref:Uncharacterized protein n=1 Tax=Bhargavaea cecembensis DSE10 TaxID=1235279 RepID=M7NDA5_9BACL|nr:hypothetical protein [Bhargavaea cecembensis]EMR06563.1 hypothetical protein C772_01458 [Bhargavaea cecembensis DSE10]